MKFRLVGGPFEILDTPHCGDSHLLKCFLGGVFEIEEKLARHAISHGAPIVPAEMFESFGFTAEELAKHPNSKLRDGAPAEFLAKYEAAMQAFHDYRAQVVQELAAQEG